MKKATENTEAVKIEVVGVTEDEKFTVEMWHCGETVFEMETYTSVFLGDWQ